MTNCSNSGESKGPALSAAGAGWPSIGGGCSGACSGLAGDCGASGSRCAVELAGGSEGGGHITVGHGVESQRCAQIYYDIASDGLVELAWVGEHRPTVSEDT